MSADRDIDTSDQHRRPGPVVVVGAGLAGLAAAATAARAGARVTVVDGHPAGGRARTDERRGFRFNQGAHALYLGGPAEREMAALGLARPAGAPPSGDVWGRRGTDMSPLPTTPLRAVRSRLVGLAGAAQLAGLVREIRATGTSDGAGQSFTAWLEERGLRDDVAAVVATVARVASYADDLSAISADAVLGQLRSSLGEGVRYLDGGWQVLVDGLLAAATGAGADVRTGSAVAEVEVGGDDVRSGRLRVVLRDGTAIPADSVVVAVGGPDATAALLPTPPRWSGLGPPSTVACLDLGLRRVPERPVVFGIGDPTYLSTHAPSADLAPPGRAVVHLMRYGARAASLDRAALWDLARAAGVRDDDVIEQRFLARMVTSHAVPVPGGGLAGRPEVDGAGVPGVYVAGDWVGPDGLLADAAVASGATAGRRAAADAARAPGPVAGRTAVP